MRRCGIAAGLIGLFVWCVAHALATLVIWVIFAVPFGLLFALDALAGEHAHASGLALVPPTPPRRPVRVTRSESLAA